jgi:hypothetical protein
MLPYIIVDMDGPTQAMQIVTVAKKIRGMSRFFVNINKSPLGAPAFDCENIGREWPPT